MLSALGALLSIITSCTLAVLRVVGPVFDTVWAQTVKATKKTEPYNARALSNLNVREMSAGSRIKEDVISLRNFGTRTHSLLDEAVLQVREPFTTQKPFSAPDLRSIQHRESPNYSSYNARLADFLSGTSRSLDDGDDVFQKLGDYERGRASSSGPLRTYSFKF